MSTGRFAVLLFGLVLAATPVRAGDPAAAAALRAKGRELAFNLDRTEAAEAFKAAIAADPEDPTAYRLLAGVAWAQLLFEQGAITVDDYLGQARATLQRAAPSPQLASQFRQALQQAIARAESQLRAHPDDPAAHYQVGAAVGFEASYTATVEGRVVGSLGLARRAYHEHERVLTLDPQRKDAGLIVGLYRYGVSALPLPLRLMARIAGFAGGREDGLRLVEEASRYESDMQGNALFTLIVIYNREKRYDDALAVIGELQRRYPRNRLLWLEEGSTALRAGRPANARRALEHGLARLANDPRPRGSGELSRWQYAYGTALVALHEAGGAEPALRAAIESATRDWVRGRAHKELGKLADQSGDRARALDEYRTALRLCRQDHDGDCEDEITTLMKSGRNGSQEAMR